MAGKIEKLNPYTVGYDSGYSKAIRDLHTYFEWNGLVARNGGADRSRYICRPKSKKQLEILIRKTINLLMSDSLAREHFKEFGGMMKYGLRFPKGLSFEEMKITEDTELVLLE